MQRAPVRLISDHLHFNKPSLLQRLFSCPSHLFVSLSSLLLVNSNAFLTRARHVQGNVCLSIEKEELNLLPGYRKPCAKCTTCIWIESSQHHIFTISTSSHRQGHSRKCMLYSTVLGLLKLRCTSHSFMKKLSHSRKIAMIIVKMQKKGHRNQKSRVAKATDRFCRRRQLHNLNQVTQIQTLWLINCSVRSLSVV